MVLLMLQPQLDAAPPAAPQTPLPPPPHSHHSASGIPADMFGLSVDMPAGLGGWGHQVQAGRQVSQQTRATSIPNWPANGLPTLAVVRGGEGARAGEVWVSWVPPLKFARVHMYTPTLCQGAPEPSQPPRVSEEG